MPFSMKKKIGDLTLLSTLVLTVKYAAPVSKAEVAIKEIIKLY